MTVHGTTWEGKLLLWVTLLVLVSLPFWIILSKLLLYSVLCHTESGNISSEDFILKFCQELCGKGSRGPYLLAFIIDVCEEFFELGVSNEFFTIQKALQVSKLIFYMQRFWVNMLSINFHLCFLVVWGSCVRPWQDSQGVLEIQIKASNTKVCHERSIKNRINFCVTFV